MQAVNRRNEMFIKIEPVRYKKNDENNIIQSNRKILEERYTVVKDIDCHILEQLETEAEVEKEIAGAAEFEKAVIEILVNRIIFKEVSLCCRKTQVSVIDSKCFFPLGRQGCSKNVRRRVPFPY